MSGRRTLSVLAVWTMPAASCEPMNKPKGMAAMVRIATFCGFVAGGVAGLREFGAGLALAILIDVTSVRMILVPSLMAIFGRWNWWLPKGGSRSCLASSTRST